METHLANKNLVSLKQISVLVVDDNADNRMLLGYILRRAGIAAESASGGVEAVSMIGRQSYDIILLDIQMPDVDGFETLALLRNAGCKCPIVACTAHAMHLDRKKSIGAGFADHLTKPINNDVLMSILRRLVTPPEPHI